MKIILSLKKKWKKTNKQKNSKNPQTEDRTRKCWFWSSVTSVVLQKWAFKSENVCAYTDTVLLPKWGLLSPEAFRREQLELICHGRAHLDWALRLDRLSTNFSPCTDLSKVSLEVAFKVTSWEHTFFEDSPLSTFAISACRWFYALPINIVQYDACTVVS